MRCISCQELMFVLHFARSGTPGTEVVFMITGSGLLLMNYLAAIILAIRMPGAFRAPVMIGGHAILALALIGQTLKLESDKYTVPAIQAFYRFIWNLFYSEYLLLPFL